MLRTRVALVLFAGFVILLGAGQATATVISPITQDTTLFGHDVEGVCQMNMGAYEHSPPGTGNYVLGYENRPQGLHDRPRPILQADGIVTDLTTAGVTASSQIASAQLHVFNMDEDDQGGTPADRVLNAYRVSGDTPWAEGNSLWAYEAGAASWTHRLAPTAWSTPGGDYDPTSLGTFTVLLTAPLYTEHTVTITDAVKHWFDNPTENNGVLLIQDLTTEETSVRFFASSESTVAGNAYRPYITVDLVPEPSTLMLLATGLVGLLAYAWRKRR